MNRLWGVREEPAAAAITTLHGHKLLVNQVLWGKGCILWFNRGMPLSSDCRHCQVAQTQAAIQAESVVCWLQSERRAC